MPEETLAHTRIPLRNYLALGAVAAVLVTALMVTLAAAIPARRAASIDPMKALRSE